MRAVAALDPFTIIESFKLHDGQLESWKEPSKNIDTDIAKAEGFISRDSGIDADSRVYCIVKWESYEQTGERRRLIC